MNVSTYQQFGKALGSAKALAAKSNDREKALVEAAEQMLEGHWDRVLAAYPRDALPLQSAHLTDFYLGDATNLRDRVSRVIGHWDSGMPGYSFILGRHAFGLEECNEYAKAEEAARVALEIERRDGWSVHALAHVMEMQNRYAEGQEFLVSRAPDWAPDNGLAFHNWWHLALFHLEQEDYAAALKLYDEIEASESDISLELVDASALLWRITLGGHDVGDRWQKTAAAWAGKVEVEGGYYAFNDLHAIMAFVGADKLDEARGRGRANSSRDRQPGSDGNNGASYRGIGMFRDDRIRRTML